LVARSKEKLEKLSKELSDSLVVVCDMTDPVAIKKMVKKVYNHYGKIDILVNNAGRGYDASVEETDVNKFREIFNLDVVGPLIAMQEVIPIMRKQKSGAIFNVSSGTALMPLPNMSAYSSAKRALAQISLTAREELKESNIAVGVIYPYVTLTNFEKNTIKNVNQTEEEGDWIGNLPNPPDTAEYIAEKIVGTIETGKAEIYAHDWMKR